MKQKRITSVILAFLLALTCSACSAKPETPEQVIEKMQTAVAETPCSNVKMVMDMTMALDSGELGVQEISTTITNDMLISQDPVSGYTTSTIEASYGDEPIQTVAENYSVVENGELVSYILSSGVWMRVPTGQTAEELKNSASSISIDAANAVIDETVTELDGKEVICLTTQLSGSMLENVIDGMLDGIGLDSADMTEASESISSIDYSALTCDTKIYLDKETYLPVKEEMSFFGMSDVLAPFYSALGMTVDVTNCTATASYLSYEPQEEITLPDGAKEKAEAWEHLLSGDPENADGTFTIREGSYLVDIAAPEGFELAEKDYDHVIFTRDDYREITYTMYYGSEDYLAGRADNQLNRYGNLPNSVSREQMTLEGESFSFDCDVVGVEWTSYESGLIYAWAELGSDEATTYYLFVEISDGFNDGLGNSKSADITPDEFMAYLNAATLSTLMN